MTEPPSAWKFSFHAMPEAIIAGWGCRRLLAEEADALGLSRLLVVCSPGLRRTTTFIDDVDERLGARLVGICDTVRPNNPDDALELAAASARPLAIDGVVSIGGGATHDAAKALALMVPSGRSVLAFAANFEPPDRIHLPNIDVAALPLITIPSTFSAAEVLGGGAVTDIVRRRKYLFVHPMLTPRRVFLDGEVVASTPPETLALSGLNAVHHCLESLYATGRQPLTDAFALAALAELFEVLPLITGPDRGAATMQRAIEAASLSGLTYASSGLGIGHAVCHVLGGRYGLVHAAANAVVVRHSVRFNRPVATAALARAARACRAVGPDAPDEHAADALISALDRLCTRLGAPARLRDIGLPPEALEPMAADVLVDPCAGTNPRPLSHADVVEFLKAAW